MKPCKFVLFLCLLLGAVTGPARAEDPPTPAQLAKQAAEHDSGVGLVDLFDKTCIGYAGKDAQLRVWLDVNATQASPEQTSYFLGDGQGKVWLVRNKAGNYAIVISDAMAMCTVKAEKGPVDDVAKYFSEQAPKLHVQIKQSTDDANGTFMGASGRVVTYALQSDGNNYMVILVGHQKADIPLQSQLTLANAAPPQ